MRHRPPTRTCVLAATLVTVVMTTGCSDDQSDGSADPSADSSVMSTTSSSSGSSSGSSGSSSTPSNSTPARPPDSPPGSPPATSGASSPRATPTPPPASPAPPFIASADWADSDYGVTLKVAPTPAGRQAWGVYDSAAAWQEVLRLRPDADTPGMWEQFDCHWTWARILEPDKPTWNVEPWRPVVAADQMLVEGCNPGGPEV